MQYLIEYYVSIKYKYMYSLYGSANKKYIETENIAHCHISSKYTYFLIGYMLLRDQTLETITNSFLMMKSDVFPQW